MLSVNFSATHRIDISHLIGKFVAPAETRSSWLRYGLAVLLPCIGFLVTWQVFNLQRAPYFGLFMASVVIISLFGGTGPGLLDTLVSSILGFLVAQPAWTLRLEQKEDAIRIGLFTALGILISTIVGVVGELQRKLNRETGTLATTLRSIGDAVVTTDSAGTITFLNDVAQRITGWHLDDAVGKPIEAIVQLVRLDSRSPIRNSVRQVLDSGHIAALAEDVVLIRRDGSEILIGDSAAPIFDQKNDIVGVVQLFHDITESRREAEMERHRLREILANAPAAIGVMRGTELRWEYLNTEYVRVLGRENASDIVGKTLRESLPELENQPYIGLLEEVYRSATPFIGSEMKATLNRGPNGQPEEAFFDLVFQPLRDRAGCVDGVLIHAVEVTDRINIKKHIREAEKARRLLATIVESSDDAIISKDLNGIITSWNSAAAMLFGYTAAEIIGKSITTLIPPELHHDEQRILATIARGDRIEHFETIRVTKGGERLSVSLTISPLRDETGKIIGAAKILRDITQQKMAEKALHQSERLACVGRLATTVAHEINNPLEAVTNLVYLAKQTSIQDEVRGYLQIADEELNRIAYITRQTLGFFRETKGATPVRLGKLLDSAILVASKTRNKGIKICPEVRHDPEICAIPGEVRQLIINLLSNSIDAVDSDGHVRVRISDRMDSRGDSRGVKLVIADSGCGIPSKGLSNIFQPFFTTKTDVGVGLGLWVCKNIVDKHGGSIRVKSCTTPGKSGTVFTVFLPLLPPATISENQAASAAC
jgi:PAS domain S-box-containing protein